MGVTIFRLHREGASEFRVCPEKSTRERERERKMERERDRNENEGARQNEREWEGDARGRDSGNAGSYRFPESRVASRESASETHARADESKRETASREWRASLSLSSLGEMRVDASERAGLEKRDIARVRLSGCIFLSLRLSMGIVEMLHVRVEAFPSLSLSLTHSSPSLFSFVEE